MIATSSTSEIACPPWVSETSDDYRLHETVIQGLRRSGYSSLSEIKCEVVDGVVAVCGVVPSFFLKQMAQTIILRIGQAKAIRNNLKVPHSYFDPSL
jgi:osmotically-inducible protein OsmY